MRNDQLREVWAEIQEATGGSAPPAPMSLPILLFGLRVAQLARADNASLPPIAPDGTAQAVSAVQGQ